MARFYLSADGRKPDGLYDGVLRESLGKVIRKRLSVRRIARQCIGQRRLRLRIAASLRERYCRGSILTGCIRISEQRFAYRCVRLPQGGGLFLTTAASALDSLPG